MEKFLYPTHPVRCIITGPSECGNSLFLTDLNLNIINEYDKIYIYSTSLHQELYQNIIKCSGKYIPINISPNILNEEEIDSLIEEVFINEDFEKSGTELETFDTIEELKFPQDLEDGGIIILEDLGEKEMNDPRVQAMFKRSRHKNLSKFIISQGYYELRKRTIRANRNIYHIFKPNNFREVQNLYQDRASMDMSLNEIKNLTTCWDKKYQTFTIDISKGKYTGRYRLGLQSKFVPDSSPF